QNLETEKRRLLLAREIASSPLSIRKAADALGMHETSEMAAVQISQDKANAKTNATAPTRAMPIAAKSSEANAVVRTVLTAPVQPKATGETRSRIVEPSKDKKEKNEVAALLKLR
ncbi:MAG: hypothetical protein ABI646_04555, partial [Acidobacteriota bacterium]